MNWTFWIFLALGLGVIVSQILLLRHFNQPMRRHLPTKPDHSSSETPAEPRSKEE